VRLNIFAIPSAEVDQLREKLASTGMTVIKQVSQDGWIGSFYYSAEPYGKPAGWAKTYASYFEGPIKPPRNLSYWAAYVFTKGNQCFVLSYGKAHFFVRPYCDYDFGIEVAKRIANEDDIRQTASKRFQGTKKKDIRSYANDTALDVESGESVDYLQAGIISEQRAVFGRTGKFGTSVLVTPKIDLATLGKFLSDLNAVVATPARFPLPRTTIITEAAEVAKFDELLLDELTSDIGTTEFTHNSYDLFGVDFVFSNDGTFTLSAPRKPALELEHLSVGDLKDYIKAQGIAREDILDIKVKLDSDEVPRFNRPLKETLDFIADDDRVVLTGGKWMHFNQDYLDFLDAALKMIEVEPTESQFTLIEGTEPDFNESDEVEAAGYTYADKDFGVLKTRASTPVEAWDLQRGKTVYAVKFGTPQKLNYVVDQATNVLEILRNKANVNQIPNFERYCLWIGYRSQKPVTDITLTGSIIFKQKLEIWARKAREVGVVPVLKISQSKKPPKKK
jgi:uncharacterized protein (TIGR04141 family)